MSDASPLMTRLAAECQAMMEARPGYTGRPLEADTMRSYVALMLFQERFGLTLDAQALAQRTGIGRGQATEHIRALMDFGLLRAGPSGWRFELVPRALTRKA